MKCQKRETREFKDERGSGAGGWRYVLRVSLWQLVGRKMVHGRQGKVAYGDVPKCDWRRRMANDGKKIARLIQHKGKVILQKAVLLGAEDEQEEGGGGSGAGGCGGGGGGGGGGRAAAACQGAFQGQEKQGQEDS